MFRKNPPTPPPVGLVQDMIRDLTSRAPTVKRVCQGHTGVPVVPEELFFPTLHAWLRTSDLHITGDISLDFCAGKPGLIRGIVLRAAVARHRERWDGERWHD